MNPVAGIAVEAARLFGPLRYACSSGFDFRCLLYDMGWYIDLAEIDDALIGSLPGIAELVENVPKAVAAADALAAPGSAGEDTAEILSALEGIRAGIHAITTFDPAGQIQNAASPLASASFWTDLALDLPEYLIVRYLRVFHKPLYGALRLLGIIEDARRPNLPGTGQDDRTYDRLVWDRLVGVIQGEIDPALTEPGRAIRELQRAFTALGLPTRLEMLSPQITEDFYSTANPQLETARQLSVPIIDTMVGDDAVRLEAVFAEVPEANKNSPPDSVYVSAITMTNNGDGFHLGDVWELIPTISGDSGGTTGLVINPQTITVFPPNPAEAVDLNLALEGTPAHPWQFPQDSALAIGVSKVRLGGSYSLQPAELALLLELLGVQADISPEGDSFLSTLIGDGFSVTADVLLEWSPSSGLTLTLRQSSSAVSPASEEGGYGATIPIDKTIGPIVIHDVDVSLLLGAEIRLNIGAAVGANLGPLTIIVDGIGLAMTLARESNPDFANLGPFRISFGFKPPDGVGLAIDAGPVSGGGVLYILPETGEYNGILDLDLFSIGISAVGLIDTQIPGGGWSLFFALFIDLPSIPLGFGFTLNGVGGVAGINRSIDVEALQSAIRAGSLDAILFPPNPIADAPIIIDSFKAIFPSAPDRYVFGPVIKIGWGSPTLIEAVVGVIIELPDPIKIAVIGTVTSILPTSDTDLVALHLEVAGIIDMGAATLSIDASLHGSHLAGFPLSGGMALRSAFGDAPSFLMALGGSHPAFIRPSGFPEIERLSLAINAGSLIDIRFDCYFAVSTNSLQFGAAFEMSAEVEGFGIHGRAEFDAQIIFKPFSLTVGLGYHISVKAAGVDLLAVWLDVTLSGPNPWRVVGTATFTILGIDTTIRLDETIGSKKAEELPDSVDLLDLLCEALEQMDAWSIGAGGGQGVVFAAGDPLEGELVVPPDGTLGVSQKVVPLGITIDKAVPWVVGGYNQFDLSTGENSLTSTGSLTEWFPVSAYIDLKPNERLSAPSFEQLKAGIAFGGGGPTAGKVLEGTLDYDQSIRDPAMREENEKQDTYNIKDDPRLGSLAGMVTGQAASGFSIAAEEIPQVVSPGYAVTRRETGAVVARSRTWTASRASSAGRKTSTVVVPNWELEE